MADTKLPRFDELKDMQSTDIKYIELTALKFYKYYAKKENDRFVYLGKYVEFSNQKDTSNNDFNVYNFTSIDGKNLTIELLMKSPLLNEKNIIEVQQPQLPKFQDLNINSNYDAPVTVFDLTSGRMR